MKSKLAALALVAALGGCATLGTVSNPATPTELATVESAYGVALAAAVAYRHLPLCKKGQSILAGGCAERTVVVQLQAADRNVQRVLANARAFIRNNPTLGIGSVIGEVQAAVSTFTQIEAINGVAKVP
jgi:hypothetical protein